MISTIRFLMIGIVIQGCQSTQIESDGLTGQEIETVIRNSLPQILNCYETAHSNKEFVNGRITTRWEIDPMGKVKNVEILKDTIKNTSMNQCILNSISTWIFPQPRQKDITRPLSVKVRYPFNFIR